MNYLLHIHAIIIAVIIGLPLAISLNINSALVQAIIIVIIYIFLINFLNELEKLEKGTNNNNISYVDDDNIVNNIVDDDNVVDNRSILLDNLSHDELKYNLNNDKEHPYKPKNYQEYKSYNDNQLDNDSKHSISMKAPHSEKHLEISKTFYPSLTENQVNYNDCTNHGFSELSCNQPADDANLYPTMSILTKGISNESDLKQIIREDF